MRPVTIGRSARIAVFFSAAWAALSLGRPPTCVANPAAAGLIRDVRPTKVERGDTLTVELTGAADKLDAFLEAIDKSVILETVRTGSSGIGRGERILRV